MIVWRGRGDQHGGLVKVQTRDTAPLHNRGAARGKLAVAHIYTCFIYLIQFKGKMQALGQSRQLQASPGRHRHLALRRGIPRRHVTAGSSGNSTQPASALQSTEARLLEEVLGELRTLNGRVSKLNKSVSYQALSRGPEGERNCSGPGHALASDRHCILSHCGIDCTQVQRLETRVGDLYEFTSLPIIG